MARPGPLAAPTCGVLLRSWWGRGMASCHLPCWRTYRHASPSRVLRTRCRHSRRGWRRCRRATHAWHPGLFLLLPRVLGTLFAPMSESGVAGRVMHGRPRPPRRAGRQGRMRSMRRRHSMHTTHSRATGHTTHRGGNRTWTRGSTMHQRRSTMHTIPSSSSRIRRQVGTAAVAPRRRPTPRRRPMLHLRPVPRTAPAPCRSTGARTARRRRATRRT